MIKKYPNNLILNPRFGIGASIESSGNNTDPNKVPKGDGLYVAYYSLNNKAVSASTSPRPIIGLGSDSVLQLPTFEGAAFLFRANFAQEKRTATNTTTGDGVSAILYVDGVITQAMTDTTEADKHANCDSDGLISALISGQFSYQRLVEHSADSKKVNVRFRNYLTTPLSFVNETCINKQTVSISVGFSSVQLPITINEDSATGQNFNVEDLLA